MAQTINQKNIFPCIIDMNALNKKYSTVYKHSPSTPLPREKLLEGSVQSLSDTELLALLLGSGTKNYSIFSIAKQLLEKLDSYRASDISIKHLLRINGLGKAKAMAVLAALEIGRRRFIPRKWRVKCPLEILPLLSHYSDRDQEHFIVITLNGANEVLSKHVVSVGLLNKTLVHPREVFTFAVQDHAVSVILAHNHPSGNVEPSIEDIEVTQTLVKAGNILNITVLDHIIFYITNYYSFYGEGKLEEIENNANL